MKNSKTKILSFVILSAMVIVLTMLSLILEEKKDVAFSAIKLEGNQLCSKSDYLEFLHLNSADEFPYLNAHIVRDRFQKHPYIDGVTVIQNKNVLDITIKEKGIDAILVSEDTQYLITDKMQVIPFLPKTYQLNIPVISNPKFVKKLKVMSSCKKQKDIIDALKIIATVKAANPEFLSSVSEIDLRNGKDIVLLMEGKNYPVIIGRGNLVKKSYCLSSSSVFLNNNSLNKIINHIDLRYNDMLVFGFKDSLIEAKDNKI
jgi:cell division septal protein FtsQ